MSPEEKQRVTACVLEVITNEFRGDFESIYELTWSATGNRAAAQPNNDIRNALNHLGDAIVARTSGEADWHILRARRHLQFAIYDSLAVMFGYRMVHVCDLVDWVRHRGIIQPDHRGRIRRIASGYPKIAFDRIPDDALALEDIQSMKETNAKIESLVADCNYFDDELLIAFPALEQHGMTFFKRYGSIVNVNLEDRFPWIKAEEAGKPRKLVGFQSRKLLAPPKSKSANWSDWWNRFSARKKAIITVCGYAGVLLVLLSGIELAVLRSVELLLPIVCVCVVGAAIGSYAVVLELEDGGASRPSRN